LVVAQALAIHEVGDFWGLPEKLGIRVVRFNEWFEITCGGKVIGLNLWTIYASLGL
jgi:hypothetical protein